MDVLMGSDLQINTMLDRNCVIEEITDDGLGIPSDMQSSIFDTFLITKDVKTDTSLGSTFDIE